MKKLMTCVAVLAGAALGTTFLNAEVQASDAHCYENRSYEYRTVIRYETRQERLVRRVTLYDHCGRAYLADKVYFRTVNVPVKQLVKVYY